MHMLITAIGSAGDVHPFVGLGQTLRERGHRVTICASPVFQPLIERCGLRFLPVGTEAEYHAAMADPQLWDPRTSLQTLWRIIVPSLRPLYEQLVAELDDDTVILGSLWAFSARLVQEKYGVPVATAQVSPSTFLSARVPPVHKRFTLPSGLPYALRAGIVRGIDRFVIDRLCGPALNGLRRELGLPPARSIMGQWMHSPQCVLALFPDWFGPPQSDWPAQVMTTGFPLFDEAGLHAADEVLDAFLDAGTPPVIVTPGSTVTDANAYFGAALRALRDSGRRALLLTREGERLGALPATVLVRPYVPMSQVLPRAAALIHHGGVGTTALALAAGVPQLATPFAHDQFDNAERVQRLGCGLRLDSPVDPAALGKALRRLLDDDSMQARCSEYRARVDAGAVSRGRAADALEQLGRGASLRKHAA